MGSVTVIFIIPIMFVVMLFGTVTGAVKGDNVTKVQLPYNPDEGLVWEYDGVDDPLFDLVETEVKGNEQVFTFKGKSFVDVMKNELDTELVMDVVFSNVKGDELLYYACVNHGYISLYEKIEFYSPDEYILFSYSPEEETTVEGAEWIVWGNSTNIYAEKEVDGEKTFTFLFLPDKEIGTVFHEEFYYMIKATETEKATYYEKMIIEIKATVGEYEIKDEDRKYYDGSRWLSYNPALREE